MKYLAERDLRVLRREALASGSDVLHALGCLECNLREEFLFVLALAGWTEEEFMKAYFTDLMGGLRG